MGENTYILIGINQFRNTYMKLMRQNRRKTCLLVSLLKHCFQNVDFVVSTFMILIVCLISWQANSLPPCPFSLLLQFFLSSVSSMRGDYKSHVQKSKSNLEEELLAVKYRT